MTTAVSAVGQFSPERGHIYCEGGRTLTRYLRAVTLGISRPTIGIEHLWRGWKPVLRFERLQQPQSPRRREIPVLCC